MNTVSKNLRVGTQVVNSDKLLANLKLEIKRLQRIRTSLIDKGFDYSHPLVKEYSDMIQKRVSVMESIVTDAA